MFEQKFFIGVNIDSSLESKKKLFPLFQLESVIYDNQSFLGKTIEAPTVLQDLETFEKHVESIIKRLNPKSSYALVIFPK